MVVIVTGINVWMVACSYGEHRRRQLGSGAASIYLYVFALNNLVEPLSAHVVYSLVPLAGDTNLNLKCSVNSQTDQAESASSCSDLCLQRSLGPQ